MSKPMLPTVLRCYFTSSRNILLREELIVTLLYLGVTDALGVTV